MKWITHLAKYQRVQAGDLVFNKLRTWQGGFGASRDEGIVSPAYFVLRPAGVDSRFVDYQLHSAPYLAELSRVSKWMPPSQFDIGWTDLKSIPLALPPIDEQWRIAHFLDNQISRIDNVIAARQAQRAVHGVVLQQAVDRAALRSDVPTVRASRVSRVLPGWAFPSEGFSNDPNDVRLLRGINLSVGSTRWEEVVYWPEADAGGIEAFALTPGDVVLGMDRPWIGDGLRIARIVEDDLPAFLLQRVAKFLPGPAVRPAYLFWMYRATTFRTEVESDLTGLSVPHLSGDQITSHLFPLPILAEQDRVVSELDALEAYLHVGASLIDHSIDLLAEYKQSLITAAVTGEMDVTTSSGRALPA